MNTAAGNYEPEQIPSRTEMTSLVEIKSRLVAIEQGQSVLCERLDKVLAVMEGFDAEFGDICRSFGEQGKKLDCLQGKELLSQFKANGHKPKRRKR